MFLGGDDLVHRGAGLICLHRAEKPTQVRGQEIVLIFHHKTMRKQPLSEDLTLSKL